MNGLIETGAAELTMHTTLPGNRVAAPDLASFARALRQRGLLVRTEMVSSITQGWNDAPELWMGSMSVYEAHLRRVAMEQVLETLRRGGRSEE